MDEIKLFFDNINYRRKIIDEHEKKYAKNLASKFNSMSFLKWNENKVSEILVFLLNPNSDHQQGDIYLKIFLKTLDIKFLFTSVNHVVVDLEEETFTKRRVDIVIKNTFTKQIIGIENKIYAWTKDQDNQMIDYLEYIKNIADTSQYHLIYLAPKLKEISQSSIDKRKLEDEMEKGVIKLINYEDDIIPLLSEFIKNTENERVKSFVVDFQRQLIENYMGEENIENNFMTSYINSSTENIEMAFAVSNSLHSVKQEIFKIFVSQMQEVADEISQKEQINIKFDEKSWHFHLPNLKNTYVKINDEAGGILYGIVKKPEIFDINQEKVYCDSLREYLGVKFRTSKWWPLWYMQYENIDHVPNFWIDVESGKVKEFMKLFIIKVLHAPEEMLANL